MRASTRLQLVLLALGLPIPGCCCASRCAPCREPETSIVVPARVAVPVLNHPPLAELARGAEVGTPAERIGPPTPPASSMALRIYVFAIGQADSMLIVGPGPRYRTLLVDCGEEVHPPQAGEPPLRYHEVARDLREIFGALPGGAADRTRLDYFMVSHLHPDHVGQTVAVGPAHRQHAELTMSGIKGLLENEGFTVGTWIDVGDEARQFMDGKTLAPVFQAVTASRTAWHDAGRVGTFVRPQFGTGLVDLGAGVSLDVVAYGGRVSDHDAGIFWDVAAQEGAGYFDGAPATENDLSIAFLLKAGEFEMFTGGDLTGAKTDDRSTLATASTHGSDGGDGTYCNVEARLLRHWIDTRRECNVEVYRADHHGSSHASTKYLVDALDPEFVIYSCGGDYDYPAKDTALRASRTARMFVTTALAHRTWPHDQDFEALGGTILAKEGKRYLEIDVSSDGTWYWIDGEKHRAFTDAEEAQHLDVGEERAHH